MAWIKTIGYDQATGELRILYDELLRSRGKLANVHQIQSLDPAALRAHMDLYMAVMFGKSALKRYQREMLAVVVSASNRCAYCVEHHRQALLFYWKDDKRTRQLAADPASADLDAADLALCQYAQRLTLQPGQSSIDHIEQLRALGFSDEAILSATQVVAYFNFVNRLVLALGVELSEEEASGYKY